MERGNKHLGGRKMDSSTIVVFSMTLLLLAGIPLAALLFLFLTGLADDLCNHACAGFNRRKKRPSRDA